MNRRDLLMSGMGLAVSGSAALERASAAAPAPGAWLQYRGNAAQTGVAAGTLRPKLKVAWKFKTGKAIMSSPVVDRAGRIFVGSDDKKLHAIRPNGKQLWTFQTSAEVQAPPAVVGNLVVFGSVDGYLYAVDTATGKFRWKYRTDDKILGAANYAPAPTGGGTWIVVGSYDSILHCVNAGTGKRQWVYETGNYVNGTPAITGGKVVFGNCDGNLYTLSLKDGKPLGTPLEVRNYIPSSIAVDKNIAYFGHYGNEVMAANLATGKLDWTFKDRQFPYVSAAAVAADRIVIGGRDKRVHCIKRADGKEAWNARTRGEVDSSPVICDGKVVVGSEDGRVYLLGLADGKELWNYQVGAPVMSSPAVVSGRVYIGANDGYLYAFAGA
jgi:outer membrane protein assembly factor BamB